MSDGSSNLPELLERVTDYDAQIDQGLWWALQGDLTALLSRMIDLKTISKEGKDAEA